MRRYAELKPSSGVRIPDATRRNVILRDAGCVGPRAGLPGPCSGGIELDHVRASHAMGLKSRSTEDNLASLCASHHRYRTSFGREARPRLLAYLAQFDRVPHG